VCPLIVARKELGKNVIAPTKASESNTRIVGHVISYAVRALSRKVGYYYIQELLVIINRNYTTFSTASVSSGQSSWLQIQRSGFDSWNRVHSAS
jgi:hypothetical protein